jgi:hypothetical protein
LIVEMDKDFKIKIGGDPSYPPDFTYTTYSPITDGGGYTAADAVISRPDEAGDADAVHVTCDKPVVDDGASINIAPKV